MSCATLTEHNTILFSDGTEMAVPADLVSFSCDENELVLRRHTNIEGWERLSGRPPTKYTTVEWEIIARSGTAVSIDDTHKILRLPGGAARFERSIQMVRQSPTGDSFIVVLTRDPANTRNVFAVNSKGQMLWQIAAPSGRPETDSYYAVYYIGRELNAENHSGFRAAIDENTGQVISTVISR